MRVAGWWMRGEREGWAYNTMFILPLVVVLALTCQGLQTPTLVEWSCRNVVFSKVLLGLFFLAMAVLVLVM